MNEKKISSLWEWFFISILSLFHFGFLLFWSYSFFNYPTLDDVARAFTYIHSFATGKIYIYQLDLSYHGTLLLIPIYNFFMKVMGPDNIMSFRTANIVISTVALLIVLVKLKSNIRRAVFFVLFTFSHVVFFRNQLFAGNYTLVPFFVFAILLFSDSFIKGFLTGLAIYTHPVFLPFVILAEMKGIKRFVTGLLLGLLPSLIFNLYNMLYNIDNAVIFPTLADIMAREPLKQGFSSPPTKGTFTLKIYMILLLLTSFYLILRSRRYSTAKKVKIASLLLSLLFIGEERHISFFVSTSIFVISGTVGYGEKKIVLSSIFILVLISAFTLFRFKEDDEYCKRFILHPYSVPHCPKFDFSEIKKDVQCLKERLKEDTDFENVGGDVIAVNFIKFFWTNANIYYYYNLWSYGVPYEFDGGKKINFIIYYEYPKKENMNTFEDFIRQTARVCGFKIVPQRTGLTRTEIQKSLFFRNTPYVRKTDIKDIFYGWSDIKDKMRSAFRKIITSIIEKVKSIE